MTNGKPQRKNKMASVILTSETSGLSFAIQNGGRKSCTLEELWRERAFGATSVKTLLELGLTFHTVGEGICMIQKRHRRRVYVFEAPSTAWIYLLMDCAHCPTTTLLWSPLLNIASSMRVTGLMGGSRRGDLLSLISALKPSLFSSW